MFGTAGHEPYAAVKFYCMPGEGSRVRAVQEEYPPADFFGFHPAAQGDFPERRVVVTLKAFFSGVNPARGNTVNPYSVTGKLHGGMLGILHHGILYQ